ncbi:MAG: STAS domain-containing protein [Bacteroidota bacterium]
MVNFEREGKVDVITFSVDKINALITEEIRNEISKLFENPNSRVAVDLSGVHYIDSSGFGCFLSIMKAARNNYGTIKFASPEPAVMEVFKTLHLNTIFEIYEDRNECVRSMR